MAGLPCRMWLPLVALLAVPLCSAYVNRGFLLSAPKVLLAGTSERICVSYYNLGHSVTLKLFLLPKINSSDYQAVANGGHSTAKKSPFGALANGCFYFFVPKSVTQRRMFLRATVFSGHFRTTKTSPVSVRPFELVTLVQTDKFKYKAGQLVNFRVVTLRSDLTALEETIDQIFITTPANTRLAQFDKVRTTSGIVQLKFQLTDEPPLGIWTIQVKRGDRIVRQNFEVAEFVLPRFEVTVTGPKFIVRGANTVTFKVCALYTFGKPLTSALVRIRVTSSLSYYQISRELRRHPPTIRRNARQNVTLTDETGPDGCVEIDFILSKIGLGSKSSLNAYRVSVSTNVTESGTGLVQTESLTLPVKRRRRTITIDKFDSNFVKPGLSYTGYATLRDEDSQVVEGELVEVCYTATSRGGGSGPIKKHSGAGVSLSRQSYSSLPIIVPVPVPRDTKSSGLCREYRTNEHGRVKYLIPALDPGLLSVRISLRPATPSQPSSSSGFKSIGISRGFKFLRVWFSPTNSYIVLEPLVDPSGLKCTGSLSLSIKKNFRSSNDDTVYLVMARGQIVTQGYASGVINIKLRFEVSPRFKVLIYHVNRLGEVVTDSRTFEVAECFQNTVSVSWDRKQVQPGESATFSVEGAPNSLCGISAVDRSVELLSSANKLTASRVFEKLRRYIIGEGTYPYLVESPSKYCKRRPVASTPQLPEFTSPIFSGRNLPAVVGRFGPLLQSQVSKFPVRQPVEPLTVVGESETSGRSGQRTTYYYVVQEDDSIKAYDVAGYLPLTNLVLETRRCERRNRTICVNCFHQSTTSIQNVRASFGGATASVGQGTTSVRGEAVLRRKVSSSSAPVSVVADDTSVEVLSTSAVSTEAPVRSFFPPTFLFQLEALGSDGRLDLTQKMPDTITRWVGSAFCSNLKLGFGLSGSTSITTFKPFFAQIQVPFSVKRGELLLLKVSVFNFLPSDLSVLVALTPSKHFSLDGASATSTVCVSAGQPTVLTFPLLFFTIGKVDITVRVKTYGRACGKSTTIKASDALRRELLVKPEGFPQEEVNSAFVCIGEDGPSPILEQVELRRMPTLVPDSGRVWINVVGDLLAPSAANLRRLVRVPTGCGEQNMLGFVPNILVRRYLEAVKLLSGTLKTETTNNMVTGYQRELRYRHADGSYAAFQSSREGSLWLTAYVVRSYVAASRYIAIDSADLDVSTAWLLRHQRSDGSFPRVGRLFHREMRGGVEFGGTEALTAFVVLTLLEASGHQPAVGRALGFIGGTKTYSTLYTEVLVAHAFVQAGRTEGAQRVAALLSRGVRQGGQLHWEGDRSSKVGGSKAVDVEMTSYMVLSLLKLGGTQNIAEAALAIKWVNGRRNAVGGFVSTQDTVVALTALTEFAIATYSPKASVKVRTTATGGFRYTVLVTPSTRLLTHKKKLLPLVLPGTVRFAVSGVGCALVQSVFRFTTTTPFPDPSFRLTATIIKSRCTSFSLRICTSFSRPNAESNMAIVEIEMLSGYVTVDRTLKTLKKNGVIERWEYSEGKAVLYFSEFTTKTVCFEVRLLQDIEVEKLKPAIVRVFDYYAVEDRFEVEYGPPDCEGKKG